jgi:uncharacterized protein
MLKGFSNSEVSNNDGLDPSANQTVRWNPLLAIIFMVVVFYLSQILAGVIVSLYPVGKGWSSDQTFDWLGESVAGQFTFVLIAELLAIGAIYWFLRRYKSSWQTIGLKKPRWRDLGLGLAAVPIYYIIYILTVIVVGALVPSLNIDQEQQIGFENVHGLLQLTMTFISLAVLPPLAEEIMVRGFLYSSLKKALPVGGAVIATSAIFAAAHLPEGGDGGLLWIAALDTFVLSLVLIYLREKTGSLWASITLHAVKNSVAFLVLFVFS